MLKVFNKQFPEMSVKFYSMPHILYRTIETSAHCLIAHRGSIRCKNSLSTIQKNKKTKKESEKGR